MRENTYGISVEELACRLLLHPSLCWRLVASLVSDMLRHHVVVAGSPRRQPTVGEGCMVAPSRLGLDWQWHCLYTMLD
jgi:hypothetical protein